MCGALIIYGCNFIKIINFYISERNCLTTYMLNRGRKVDKILSCFSSGRSVSLLEVRIFDAVGCIHVF